MPFTLSHPLFAAPLRRALPSLSLTGLIAGSMAPDFEYFIAMIPLRSIGHNWEGFLLQALPIGIALSFAFHYLVKPIIPLMLPKAGGLQQFANQAIQDWKLSGIKDWTLFILSLFIGFLTHLFMDHWTHGSGWFVQRVPFLQSIRFGDYVYHILQLALSLLGVVIPFLYGFFVWRKQRRQKPPAAESAGRTQTILLWSSTIIFAAVLMLCKLIISGQYFSLSVWIVGPITSFAFGLIMAGSIHAGIKSLRKGRVILLQFAVIAVLLLFQAMKFSDLPWLTVWISYHWLLSFLLVYLSVGNRDRKHVVSIVTSEK